MGKLQDQIALITGGVINHTRSLGLEYEERNIRVNATPMKRLGQSEEMVKAALFFNDLFDKSHSSKSNYLYKYRSIRNCKEIV